MTEKPATVAQSWNITRGSGPIVAAAIHAGHVVRPEVAPYLALTDAQRLREEDPYTDRWAAIGSTRIIARQSRFEFDLNRPRHMAVYRTPAEAWGLTVWRRPLPEPLFARSIAEYDQFYQEVGKLLADLVERQGQIVVFDLHSYNHRRDGADQPPADPEQNPEINIGTGTMPRNRWTKIVRRLTDELREADYLGRRLDVRENVKFQGGHFSEWIHARFPDTICSFAIEVKKIFMDEWSGDADLLLLEEIEQVLHSAATGVLEELNRS